MDTPTLDVVAAEQALRLMTRNGCEHSIGGLGSCFADGRTADAMYGCDQACPACIAHHALTGQPVPTGIGPEAERALAEDYWLHRNHHPTFEQGDGIRADHGSACDRLGCVPVTIRVRDTQEN